MLQVGDRVKYNIFDTVYIISNVFQDENGDWRIRVEGYNSDYPMDKFILIERKVKDNWFDDSLFQL